MKTLQVPQTTYALYELTEADEFVLRLFLNLDVNYTVRARCDSVEKTYVQKIQAIKWFRMRFDLGLKEAKEAIDFYCSQHPCPV
jgi:hypothetical protein